MAYDKTQNRYTSGTVLSPVSGAAGANPTQAEYATMVALVNAMLADLKAAGIISAN